MNSKITAFLSVLCLSSCTTGGPTIAGLGAGSDAAYLNSSRGRADAQISEQQARQYSRQRQQVSEEMSLEQQKRSNFLQTTGGVLDVLNGVRGFVR
jgi:hypothetical protein